MNPKIKKRFVRFALYPAFFSASFALMLFLCFPYEALRDRIVSQARSGGLELSIDSLKPGFLSFKADGVALGISNKSPSETGMPQQAEPLRIDQLEIIPQVFPLGIHARAQLLGGKMDAFVGNGVRRQVKVRAKSLQLSRLPPQALGGMVMNGEISFLADLTTEAQDFATTEGRVAVLGNELLLSKGTVQGFSLPRIDLGRLELDAELTSGKARLTMARTTGVDLTTTIDGDIKQARKASMSSANLTLKFQPSEDFLKRNAFISSALGLAMSKDQDGFYTALMRGPFSNLKVSPQKGGSRR